MHVVMLSDVETPGGASIAASRLANALCQSDHRVTRLVNTPDNTQHQWQTQSLLPHVTHNALRRVIPSQKKEPWEQSAAEKRLDKALTALRPDVVNIHNLHSAGWAGWSPAMLRVCARHAPVVWTLHDMWSFTGRCAYSYDCNRFVVGCTSACPTPDEYPSLLPAKIASAWEHRREVINAHPNVAVVTPSQWLAHKATSGLWSEHHVEVIPNSLPLDIYRPYNQLEARRQLGIKPHGPVLLIAANDFNERRKGGNLFYEAMEQCAERPLTVIIMGKGQLSVRKDQVQVKQLGFISDDKQKALVYSAADVYVHAAPVDNLPNTVLEALACGTPIIGFTIGGVPDMVRPGQTGWLSDKVTPVGLADAIDHALTDLEHGVNLRDTCRQIADAEYSDAVQAERYSALFQKLVKQANMSVLTVACK